MKIAATDAVANIAVRDLRRARDFYEHTLELRPESAEDDELVTYRSGQSRLNVYRSDLAGTNQATAVTWALGDALEETVDELRRKGVQFEHYALPGMRREGDIHSAGDMKVVWFKDPDGNILNLVNR